MDVIIGSDHAGFTLKEECKQLLIEKSLQHTVTDIGVYCRESYDYPIIAHTVAKAIVSGEYSRGILICGSGIGMSITANRYQGIRAALCHNIYLTKMSRLHNDANILVMGDRVIGIGLALEMVEAFLDTEFEGERHKKRIELIDT